MEEVIRKAKIEFAKLQTRGETGEGEWKKWEKLLQMFLRGLAATTTATANQEENGG